MLICLCEDLLILGVINMKKKNIKKRNPIAFMMLTSGMYKQKVIKNKKKEPKKFNLKKELSYYLSTLLNKVFK